MVEDQVGLVLRSIESTVISPEAPNTLLTALEQGVEAAGCSYGSFVNRLVKQIKPSETLKPQRKLYLEQWLTTRRTFQ